MCIHREGFLISVFCLILVGCATSEKMIADACMRPKVGKGIVSFLNAKVGVVGGPSESVISAEQLTSLDGKGLHGDTLTCHAVLHYKSGKKESGTIVAVDPGADVPLNVWWKSDAKQNQKAQEWLAAQLKREKCNSIGSLYQNASAARDANRSPETALSMFQRMPIISLEEKKSIINQVYFDPTFKGAGGYALRNQMESICMKKDAPANNFQPLK